MTPTGSPTLTEREQAACRFLRVLRLLLARETTTAEQVADIVRVFAEKSPLPQVQAWVDDMLCWSRPERMQVAARILDEFWPSFEGLAAASPDVYAMLLDVGRQVIATNNPGVDPARVVAGDLGRA